MKPARIVKATKLNPITLTKYEQKTANNFNTFAQSYREEPKLMDYSPQPELKRSGTFFQMLEDTIKKELRNYQKVEMEARDRFLQIDIPQVDEDQIDDDTLKEWICQVCNSVFSTAFNSLSKDQMSYEHTKTFCSEAILRNIYQLTKKYRLSIHKMSLINEHLQKYVLPYMQKKYPLTESNDVNKAIDQSVRPIDNRQALQNDMLQKSGIVFTWRKDGNYNDLIMKFLNWLMTEIDREPEREDQKTPFEEYYTFISQLFENVYDQHWMKKKASEEDRKVNKSDLPSPAKARKADSLSNEQKVSQEKYASAVKEYTSYAIGRKISKNTLLYTEEEIESGHLNIKNPAILRILTKWCEQLRQKFTKKNYYLDRQENLRVQEVNGNINTMFMWMKMPLNDLIQKEKRNIQDFMDEIIQHNFDQQSLLLIKELERDGFAHIQKTERACGKFAVKTVNNLHSYIVILLNRFIHGLLCVSKELYQTKLNSKARWTNPPDLLSFKIGDLMRSKCSSKEREILKIFKELQYTSQRYPKFIKIIRVKNRLKLGTNDILINVLFKQKFLCQIQLAVKAAPNKFIQCSNMFSHYIYQLSRSLFGPITELCSVWTSLDPRSSEYQNVVKQEKRINMPAPFGCEKNNKVHIYSNLDRPFICHDCKVAYAHNNFIWNHKKCDSCSHMICALCRIENEGEEKLKESILHASNPELIRKCKSVVNRKPQGERVLPTYGVCIKKNSKKINVQTFKKIQIKNILSVYSIKKNKHGGESIALIEQLIKKNAERNFFRNYLVFEIPESQGEKLINITEERAKKEYILPQKVQETYKKEKEIMSLIQEQLNDKEIEIMKGEPIQMKRIENLELADNQLKTITFITENFTNLTRLQLSRNRIESIDTIEKLTKLKKLNLRDNKLARLPDQICTLKDLNGLNIRNNKITAFPADFGNLVLLQKLQADNNLIEVIPEGFANFKEMNFINLSKNRLTAFPEQIKHYKKLETLMLAKNDLKSMPEWINQLTHLQVIDCKNGKISNLPQSIFTLYKLQTLKIETKHPTIPQQISKLSKLTQLCIQMPNLNTLPKQMLALNELEVLQLQECKMDVLPDFLSEMKKLVNFSLVNNRLNRVAHELCEMEKLRYLKIEGQNIDSLPQGMKQLSELRELSLNNNKFKRIPEVVRYFTKLYNFSIAKNEIVDIADDFFQKLIDIETLILDQNKLTTLPNSIKTLRKLKKLSFLRNSEMVEPEWMEIVSETIRAVQSFNYVTFKKMETLTPS